MWCKPRYSVCKECGVHFDPVTGYEKKWGDLCKVHRVPVMERDQKREAVTEWARANWERLYEQYEKERAEQAKAYNGLAQSALSGLAMQGMANQNRQDMYGYAINPFNK